MRSRRDQERKVAMTDPTTPSRQTRRLPSNPSLRYLQEEAKDLLKAHRRGDASACAALRLPNRLSGMSDAELLAHDVRLADAQFALAAGYGFGSWAELKKHVLGRQENLRFLHIHCGDSSAGVLRNSSAPGDVLVWREIYTEGPVPGGLPEDEWRRVRAEFLATFGLDRDGVLQGTNERYRRLAEAGVYEEVVLWFDACMFDQTIMIHLIDRLGGLNLGATKKSLICISHCGLGELDPEAMAALLDERREITSAQVELAGAAWGAFTSADPREIEALLAQDCSALPFLGDALWRHLEQFPSVRNGLNRLQNQALEVVASGASKLGPIFTQVSDREEQAFFGDTTLWNCLDKLTRGAAPLLRIEGPGPIVRPMDEGLKDINRWHVTVADVGREVLAGKQDWVRLNGIDRWLGGVHLHGPETEWRWDEQERRLAAGG